MGDKGGCATCGVQVSLKEDFDPWDVVAEVKRLKLIEKSCMNCADNTFRREHNWRKVTKNQRRKLILKHAPKRHQERLLAQLDTKKRK